MNNSYSQVRFAPRSLRGMSRVRFAMLCMSFVAFIAAPRLAKAQSKDECVAAYEAGQRLRIEGKLLGARESLLICAQPSCPSVVTGDCGQWLAEIDTTIPSIVVGVRTPDGKDLLEVTVSVDGAIMRTSIDGKPIPLDPGAHKLKAEADGFLPYEETFVAQQGDKHRKVAITLKPYGWQEPTEEKLAQKSRPEPVTPAEKPDYSVRPITYVLGGVSVLAFASTAFFGIKGLNEGAAMAKPVSEGGCKPDCSEADVDAARTKIIVANVSFGVGVAAAAGAIWSYIATRPSKQEAAVEMQGSRASKPAREAASLRFDVAPSPQGSMFGLSGSF
jgi:hypothetical protein